MEHQYRRFPTEEEIRLGQEARDYPRESISAPSGFGAVQPMSTLDLVGLLGLAPMMMGGGKGGATASGARRGTFPRFNRPSPQHFPESYVAHPNRARALPAPPLEFETRQRAAEGERVKSVYQGQLLNLPDEKHWVTAAKAGNPEAVEVLTSRAEQLTKKISREYSRPVPSVKGKPAEGMLSPEEMQAEARKIVQESIREYDPNNPSGATFGTYVAHALRNRLYDYSTELSFGSEIPDKVRRSMAFLGKYDAETQKRATISPTRTGEVLPPELASIHMRSMKGRSMAPEKIRELRGRLSAPSKLDLPAAELTNQGDLQNYMKERKYSPDQSIAELRLLVSQLPPKERQAVEAYITEGTGTGEAGTTGFREVGQRAGISHEMARKNLNKAIESLRKLYGVQKPIPEISGGSDVGFPENISGRYTLPVGNFHPELERLVRRMASPGGGQPSDWPDRIGLTPGAQFRRDEPGYKAMFGNPAEDFFPGTKERPGSGATMTDTYIKLKNILNAMPTMYGRQ